MCTESVNRSSVDQCQDLIIFLDPDSIIARSVDYGVNADYNSMLDHVTLYVIFPKRLITFIVHDIFSEQRGVIKFSSFLDYW